MCGISLPPVGLCRKANKGFRSLADLMRKRLESNRTVRRWKEETAGANWPWDNLPYTVDATYLYTFSGQNSQLLAASYADSKERNCIKILSFTYLSGEPFWISKGYPGNLSDQTILEMELTEHEELRHFLGSSDELVPTTEPNKNCFSNLEQSSRDLEHILYGRDLSSCKCRPIGLYDRGFDGEKISNAFNLLVAIPSYLHGRLSLTHHETLYSGYLSSLRVIIENYHGRVKLFQSLRGSLDLRVALRYGTEMWLAGTLLRLRNHLPLRPSGHMLDSTESEPTGSSSVEASQPEVDWFAIESDDDPDFTIDDTIDVEDTEYLEVSSSEDLNESPAFAANDQQFIELSNKQTSATEIGSNLILPSAEQATWQSPRITSPSPRPVAPQSYIFEASPLVTFQEDIHRYYISGDPVSVSVSALFAQTVPKFQAYKKAKDMPRNDESGPLTDSDWLAMWAYKTIRGTVIHRLLELEFRGQLDLSQLALYPEDVQQGFHSIKAHVMALLQKWNIAGIELMLPDFHSFICGTADLILQSKENPKLFLIVDYKTTCATQANLRKPLTRQNSSLGIQNTKLNAFAIQLHVYRLCFIKLLNITQFLSTTLNRPFVMTSPTDESTKNIEEKVEVKVAVITPTQFIALDTPEFHSYPTLAAKLIRKCAAASLQIRIASRFCKSFEPFIEQSRPPSIFMIETTPHIDQNLEMLMTSFKNISRMTDEHLPLLPKFKRSDLTSLCESDLFCSRKDKSTTESRVKSVHAGEPLRLRRCIEKSQQCFTIYIAATIRSSRGASKKHSICTFSIYPDRQTTFTSCCDCIRGNSTSCAHRGRILCDLADKLNPSPFKKRSNTNLTLQKEMAARGKKKEKKSKRNPNAAQSTSSRVAETRQISQVTGTLNLPPASKRKKRQSNSLPQRSDAELQQLLAYLPAQSSQNDHVVDFTVRNLIMVRKKLQDIARGREITGIKWPRQGKGVSPDAPDLFFASRLFDVHVVLQNQAHISTLVPNSPESLPVTPAASIL